MRILKATWPPSTQAAAVSTTVFAAPKVVVPASPADVVAAIHHERHVEMYATGVGLQFFEMRKLNLLQKGTPLHLPTPAGILETLAVPAPFYTFCYLANADGIGNSNSGWR